MKKATTHPSNAFDFLRFFAALCVIFAHSYALSGQLIWPVTKEVGDRITFFAVACFFIISGFLVTKSWIRQPDLKAYFTKRVLRLWPGLFVSSLFTAFIIGPITTRLPLEAYFTHISTWSYSVYSLSLFFTQYSLPGVFEQNPYRNIVNGSLWTLQMEFACYMLVALLGIFHLFRKSFFLSWLLFSIAILTLVFSFFNLPGKLFNILIPLGWFSSYFVAGSFLLLIKEKLVYSKWLGIIAVILFVSLVSLPLYQFTGLITFPYIVLFLAHKLPLFFNGVKKFGDLSYGMYIYAFPVQQTIVSLTKQTLHPLAVFLLSILFVIPLSAVSWNFIEYPALKRKPKAQ